MVFLASLITVFSLAGQQTTAPTAPADYLVGPHDVLNVVVFGEADLSRTVTLDAEGSFDFPHIGRVRAGGLTARGIGEALTKRLKEFYVNPQVSVEVAKFRSQNVIVMGFVNAPGRYPLSGSMSVLEMLALAGSPTSAAASYVLISRPAGPGPRLPQEAAGGGSTLRLTMSELQSGHLPAGFALRDGDTINVPKAETVTVIGHVKTTGPIVLEGELTVYDVIARAGGVTDKGALNRVKVLRLIDGKVQPVRGMKLSDMVKAGDTIDVPQRYF
ncbi:MAG: polysaccharide biosynthesis/export family protein [Vicinamibacterales bacterium]